MNAVSPTVIESAAVEIPIVELPLTSRQRYIFSLFGSSRLLWLVLLVGIAWLGWSNTDPHQLVIWTLGIMLLTHIIGALVRPELRPATHTPPGNAPRTQNATLRVLLWSTRTLSRPKI